MPYSKDPTTREKQIAEHAARQKQRYANPEQREAHAERMRAKWADPAYRAERNMRKRRKEDRLQLIRLRAERMRWE